MRPADKGVHIPKPSRRPVMPPVKPPKDFQNAEKNQMTNKERMQRWFADMSKADTEKLAQWLIEMRGQSSLDDWGFCVPRGTPCRRQNEYGDVCHRCALDWLNQELK